MPEYVVSGSSVLYFTQAAKVSNKKTLPFYGSVADSDTYFYYHPQFHIWSELSNEDKLRYLVGATRIIERLNYIGQKAEDSQALQFPRTGATVIPVEIEQAAYEIALKFAEGIDPDTEARNLSVRSQGYAGSKTDYERTFVPDYVRAGVPSQTAWLLLVAYLRDPYSLTMQRTS